jgi:hypothetical protein
MVAVEAKWLFYLIYRYKPIASDQNWERANMGGGCGSEQSHQFGSYRSMNTDTFPSQDSKLY